MKTGLRIKKYADESDFSVGKVSLMSNIPEERVREIFSDGTIFIDEYISICNMFKKDFSYFM